MSTSLPLWSLAGAVSLILLVNIMVPPTHEPDQLQNPLRPHAQFINRAIHNIFCNGSLRPPNKLLHWPQYRRLQGLCHRWPIPPPLPNYLGWNPCYVKIHPKLEPLQQLQHRLHKYLTIAPAKKHRLKYYLVYHHPCPHHRSRLCQQLLHHSPPPLRLPQITVQGRPIYFV